MSVNLSTFRPVHVIGAGWHPYQNASDTPFVTLGLTAIRAALADAGIFWDAVDSTYVATTAIGIGSGGAMLRYLGLTGRPITHVENASASGSAAMRQACLEVAAGLSDVVLAVGVDKVAPLRPARNQAGIATLADHLIMPPIHFALLTDRYIAQSGAAPDTFAHVAVKNHGNAARNPMAQRQKVRTLDDVLGSRPIAGPLTALQCCPMGEGAAAVIIASENGAKRLQADFDRAIRVAASTTMTESPQARTDADLVAHSVAQALDQAGRTPADIDVAEFHDAFSVEELVYLEASGIAPAGRAADMLAEGAFHIGGRCAVSPSGGLIGMGHPMGPTGIGQIAEIAFQLRGEVSGRQQPGARIGLASMVGIGPVGYAHILERP